MCRRAHGAGYVTWLVVPKASFRLLAGADQLTHYGSSAHATRSFCRRCGSSLLFESTDRPDTIDITLANIQGEVDRPPQAHVFFEDRVPWVHVDDGLPRLGGPTGLEPS